MCRIDEGPQKENASENSPEIFRKARIFQACPNVVKNWIFVNLGVLTYVAHASLQSMCDRSSALVDARLLHNSCRRLPFSWPRQGGLAMQVRAEC